MPRPSASHVHPTVDRLAGYAWRAIVITAAGVGVLWVLGKIWVVVVALVLAAFLSRVLIAPTTWLRRHRWRPALAATAVLVGFLLALAGVFGLIGFAVGQESTDLVTSMEHAVDDIEDWLVTDAPGDLSRRDITDARDRITDAITDWFASSGGALVSGAMVALQATAGVVLGLIITFFILKDGERFTGWTLSFVPAERRGHARRLAARAWGTLGGYLRGAALLGALEGVVIGLTVALVGAQLAVPVAVITFLLAFIPFAGAIIAGLVAVLVTLSTAGIVPAVIVLVVVVLVQQLDGDLLAPLIYGKELDLHPVVILVTMTAGAALFGIAGAFLAVPLTAIAINVVAEHRSPEFGPPEPTVGGVATVAGPEPGHTSTGHPPD